MGFHRPHYSARMHGAIRALEDRRDLARTESKRFEKDSQAAAMLRGKARAYSEALELLRAIEQGNNLPRRLRWTDQRVREVMNVQRAVREELTERLTRNAH